MSHLANDYDRFRSGLPSPLEEYILENYGISLTTEYAGITIKNPFGKASGQLSLNRNQVVRDADVGLGFVILKTLIAQDETGSQSMKAWAIPAAKMTVEEIVGIRPNVRGEHGWTVTWKGRGWSESFDNYLKFFDSVISIGSENGMLVVPSVKFHLPKPEESVWKKIEYEFTTSKLYSIWLKHRNEKMPLEKDFSPTLAGDSNFSKEKDNILNWLETVPQILKSTSVAENISLGMKIFNASFEDEFQLQMLERCSTSNPTADYLIYGNRLFDPAKPFEGTIGVAYGGPDLSDRNLSVLDRWHNKMAFSATGNITTGTVAFEYLKRGATSFQMHTLFQLPDSEFEMKGGSRTERALHRLIFHPDHGFLSKFLEEKEKHSWPNGTSIPEIARFYSEQI